MSDQLHILAASPPYGYQTFRTPRFCYRCPQHHSRHGISRRMQTVFAIKLSRSVCRYKKHCVHVFVPERGRTSLAHSLLHSQLLQTRSWDRVTRWNISYWYQPKCFLKVVYGSLQDAWTSVSTRNNGFTSKPDCNVYDMPAEGLLNKWRTGQV